MQLNSTFAQRVFLIAGIYGLVAMLPQYFLEAGVGPTLPAPLVRPEFLYGFVGVTLTWQLAFLVIASDVRRYRPLMLVAVLEKLSFGVAALVLFAQDRLALDMLVGGCIDLVLALLFVLAHRATRE